MFQPTLTIATARFHNPLGTTCGLAPVNIVRETPRWTLNGYDLVANLLAYFPHFPRMISDHRASSAN